MAVVALIISGYMLFKNSQRQGNTPENKPESVDTISAYGYALEDRDTKLFKTKYEELKSILTGKDVDYEEYAKVLSELYIIDLYTINNKISKYDVGGSDYVYPDSKENYELKVRDTIYKYVEDNSYGERSQELPEVSDIEVSEIKASDYTLGETKYNGYLVTLSWEYVKDLGYDSSATLSLIKSEDKLYIVEQKNIEVAN